MATHDDVKDETDEELVAWALDLEGTTAWETKFVEDMEKVLKEGEGLSPGRRKKLQEIILERDC